MMMINILILMNLLMLGDFNELGIIFNLYEYNFNFFNFKNIYYN